ncbi:histidine ammonia-lyase [Salinispira pacifica]|uniref:Histidine ammonia-lyase n=1 Tax=Salinispira pacifica TaxID=1307761 RepID=V5WKF7_9SPIO|nr:histidine ammonia-lyase [Salinispira pacifica]AHC16125.1 Histidine ammonia-lyase [Salinispira pacifica]
MNRSFSYGDQPLKSETARALARGEIRGELSREGRRRIRSGAAQVERIVEGEEAVYGVNTGFGPLCSTRIDPEQSLLLQENILKSHSVGMGPPVPSEIARLMMVLKLQALAAGRSGIRLETMERILLMLREDAIPVVPSQGSVGASGDLAPLAHLFLPLIGLGQLRFRGAVGPAEDVLKELALDPLILGPKEGLALINGTQFILAWAVAGLEKMENLLDTADIIGAMSLEAALGSVKPFARELHELRPYAGNMETARRIRRCLHGSQILEHHKDCGRVQDPYSLRCMPQVHGASRNAWNHLRETVEIELNSVTDNPILTTDGSAVSGGNFHGQPVAIPLDYASVAAAELGNISDRRSYLLLDGTSRDLPKLLMKHTGINSGFMIPQYSSAALVSENKSLCHPPSADSIPTSLGQEDHVSMGSISARRLYEILTNVEKILAVELVCAAQAFDFRRPLRSGPILEACHRLVREYIDHADQDRVFADDLEAGRKLIQGGELAACARDAGIDESEPQDNP